MEIYTETLSMLKIGFILFLILAVIAVIATICMGEDAIDNAIKLRFLLGRDKEASLMSPPKN